MTLYFSASGSEESSLRELAAQRRSLYAGYPGLLQKAFVYQAETRRYGSHFIWVDEEAARRFLNGPTLRQMIQRFGAEPEIQQFHVFELVTGATEAAR